MSNKHATFRVLAVSYYDVDLEELESNYQTDDLVEASQIDQETFRLNTDVLIDQLQMNQPQVYVQVFDPGGQMFTDEFVREVIGIIRVDDLELHMDHNAHDRNKTVLATLNGVNGKGELVEICGYGPTMGFALRDVREQLRVITGQ